MITEDYVSFETAKLLKEKGLYGECLSMYLTPKPHSGVGNPNEAKIAPHGRDSHYYDGYQYQCEAPTIQMAMKWLRKEYNIFIQVELYSKFDDYCFELFQNTHRLMIEHREVYNSYEEACEAAIKYCLEKLI